MTMGAFVRFIRTPKSNSHRLSDGKSFYLESAILDSAKEKSLDPKRIGLFLLSGLPLIVILTLL